MRKDKLQDALKGFFLSRALDLSESTTNIYKWGLSRMCDFLGNPEVVSITEKDLQRFFQYMKEGYTPNRKNGDTRPLSGRSIENAWTAMRSFFNWAAEEYKLKKRPDANIRRPTYEEAPIIPFTEEEINRLLRACEYTAVASTEKRRQFVMRRRTWLRDVAIISVLLDTCVRVSEMCRMNVGDVNLDEGEINVKPFGTGKKTKARTVFIGMETRKAVWRYLSSRETYPESPLFVTERGDRMTRNSVRLLLSDLGERAKVPNTHPHRFRHTGAVFYLKNGGDLESLRKILGHSSIEMSTKYLHLIDSDIKTIHRIASPLDGVRRRR